MNRIWEHPGIADLREKWFRIIGYEPHKPGQANFHASKARFRSIFAGSRFGKSMAGARELEVLLIGAPFLFQRPIRLWLVAPTYNLAEKEFRYIVQDFAAYVPTIQSKLQFNPRAGRLYLQCIDGSEVIGKTCEKPAGLLGEEVDGILLCEGAKIDKDVWERYLRARIGTREGFVIVPTTPAGYNWLYEEFYLKAQSGDPNYWAEIHSVEENPFFSRDELENMRKNLPPEVYQEQCLGRFVSYSGLIYPEFSIERHVVPAFKLEPRWKRIMCMDPGVRNQWGMLWLAVDQDGRYFAYDESYEAGLKASDQAKIIAAKEAEQRHRFGFDPEPEYRIMDTDANRTDPTSGRTVRDEIAMSGYGFQLAKKNWLPGVLRVKEYMAGWKDGKPGFQVMDNCAKLIWELQRYEWKESGDSEGNPKEQERDRHNHLTACLRYIAMSMPSPEINKAEGPPQGSYAWFMRQARMQQFQMDTEGLPVGLDRDVWGEELDEEEEEERRLQNALQS